MLWHLSQSYDGVAFSLKKDILVLKQFFVYSKNIVNGLSQMTLLKEQTKLSPDLLTYWKKTVVINKWAGTKSLEFHNASLE